MGITRPTPLQSGGLLQSGVPKVPKTSGMASHDMVRAVVLATYVSDDPAHPLKKLGLQPTGVYCDCLAATSKDGGSRFFFLPAVAVAQPMGGMHKGTVYRPRATTRLVSGKDLSTITPVDAAQMDGDWVLIAFLEGRANHPIIIGHLPHPSADTGNDPALPAGQRMRLRLVDGDPMFFAHHGSRLGIDTQGNVEIDTTRANDGSLSPQSGDAPTVPGQGNVTLKVPLAASISAAICDTTFAAQPAVSTLLMMRAGSLMLSTGPSTPHLRVESTAGAALDINGAGAQAIARVGSATSPVALADALQTFWGAVQVAFAAHVHGPPVVPPVPGAFTGAPTTALPAYSPAITGASLKIPSA